MPEKEIRRCGGDVGDEAEGPAFEPEETERAERSREHRTVNVERPMGPSTNDEAQLPFAAVW
jgi:hypothetical protein